MAPVHCEGCASGKTASVPCSNASGVARPDTRSSERPDGVQVSDTSGATLPAVLDLDIESAIRSGAYREARRLIAARRGKDRDPSAAAALDALEADLCVNLVEYEDARACLSKHAMAEREAGLGSSVRALLRLVQGRLAFASGDYPQAIARYRVGLDEATANDAGAVRRRLWHGLAEAFLFIHQPEMAEDAIEQGASELIGASDRLVAGLFQRARAQLLYQRADLEAARRAAHDALGQLDAWPLERAITHNLIANIANELGDPELRLRHRQAALADAKLTENRRWLGRLHHNLGDTLVQSGHLAEAEEVLIPWDRKSRRYHNLFERGTHHATVAELEYWRGHFERAVELYALAVDELTTYPSLQGETLLLMAHAVAATDRPEQALTCLRRALALAEQTQRGSLQRMARLAIAEHHIEQADLDAAQAELDELSRIADGTPSLLVTMHRLRVQGRLDAARGHLDQAAVLLERSRAVSLATDSPAWAGLAQLHLAQVQAALALGKEASDGLKGARRDLHALGIHALDALIEEIAAAVRRPSAVPPLPGANTRSTVLATGVFELLESGESGSALARALASALTAVGIPARVGEPGKTRAEARAVAVGQAVVEVDRWPQTVEAQVLVSLARRLSGAALVGASRDKGVAAASLGEIGLVGTSEAMRRVVAQLTRLRASTLPLLVTGESGVGKELVARASHRLSARAARPFVPVNCAAISSTLVASTLFGHKRGSFTGADRDSPGLVRAAAGGTLFLDEIGEVPMDVQPQLLRFLENGEVLAVGDTEPERVDVRVVTATNRDLAQMVQEKTFREDLYYRLNVMRLHVPPLRERAEDIAPLAMHFLEEANARQGTHVRMQQEAVSLLARHPLPGNARQLKHIVERLVVAAGPDGTILRSQVEEETGAVVPVRGDTADWLNAVSDEPRALHEALAAVERRLIERALERAGSVAGAAKELGISRSGLYDRMQRLGIDRGESPTEC